MGVKKKKDRDETKIEVEMTMRDLAITVIRES